MSVGARGGSFNGQSPRDRVIVASEKADFIADRIASGVAAPEDEVRRLARALREIAGDMGAAAKKPRPGATAVSAEPATGAPKDGDS